MSEPLLPGSEKPLPPPTLTDEERDQLNRLLSSPLDLPATLVSYFEQRFRLLLTVGNIQGLAQRIATVGEYKTIAKDLSANSSLYEYEDAQGLWYYCNGASFSASDDPDLNDFLGGTTLPDCRGRSLWWCGTNAACDLLDDDGVSEASRQPKHQHSDSFSVSGSPGGTFLTGISFGTISRGSAGANVYNTHTPSSGSPTKGSLAISGSVGSGMNGSDAVAHVFIGSLLIKR